MNIAWNCSCSCSSPERPEPEAAAGQEQLPAQQPAFVLQKSLSDNFDNPRGNQEYGLKNYQASPHLPLIEPPLRAGEVWHQCPQWSEQFERASLRLHANGFAIVSGQKGENWGKERHISWTPFALVQCCRLHSVKADSDFPWIHLFKVSLFHFAETHYFAPLREEDLPPEETDTLVTPEMERVRWVADIARAMRAFTRSLFPVFEIDVEPLPKRRGASTQRRLLGGYVLLCGHTMVSLVYLELGVHWNGVAPLVAYEDESCDKEVMCVNLRDTCIITERTGVDCGCFGVEGYNFAPRSVPEKVLWLRAISNIKVKLRVHAPNPTVAGIGVYRDAIRESARGLGGPDNGPAAAKPMLPRCPAYRGVSLEDLAATAEDFAGIPEVPQEDGEDSNECSAKYAMMLQMYAQVPQFAVGASVQMGAAISKDVPVWSPPLPPEDDELPLVPRAGYIAEPSLSDSSPFRRASITSEGFFSSPPPSTFVSAERTS